MSGVSRLNVLVVDRDREFRDFVSRCLASEGYDARGVEPGPEVLEAVKSGGIQLVLQDLELPDTRDGISLLQQIRAIDSDLCIIATTGSPTIDAAVATMKCRAYDYLPKPVPAERLRRVVREAVREHGLLVDLDRHLNGKVGQRIRERRSERGLTLKQLANRTGLSVSLISQIELGKSAASMSTLHKLATALGVPMTYFFETV